MSLSKSNLLLKSIIYSMFLETKLALHSRIGDNLFFLWRPSFERLYERAARAGTGMCYLDAWLGS